MQITILYTYPSPGIATYTLYTHAITRTTRVLAHKADASMCKLVHKADTSTCKFVSTRREYLWVTRGTLHLSGAVVKAQQFISLSTVVFNSRKLYSFGKISRFKNQPCNRLYPKKPAGMHW